MLNIGISIFALVLTLVAIAGLIVYKFVLRPKALHEAYKKAFEAKNLRVLSIPFMTFDTFFKTFV